MDAIPLAQAVGARIGAIRSENGIPLERIAAEARQLGLTWAKSSVAALEKGRHAIDLGVLLLLPTILARAGAWAYEYADFQGPKGVERVQTGRRHPVGVADLLPDDDRSIVLAGTVQMPARALRELLAQLSVLSLDNVRLAARLKVEGLKGSVGEETADEALRLPRRWCLTMIDAIRRHHVERLHHEEWHPDHDDVFWPAVGREAADDATRKAAAVLRVSPLAVALAARARWNGVWGLTAEREHRLAVALPGTARDTALRRKLQALRGHITRQLIDELRPLLKDVTKKRRRS